jgi:hypothetical protein
VSVTARPDDIAHPLAVLHRSAGRFEVDGDGQTTHDVGASGDDVALAVFGRELESGEEGADLSSRAAAFCRHVMEGRANMTDGEVGRIRG